MITIHTLQFFNAKRSLRLTHIALLIVSILFLIPNKMMAQSQESGIWYSYTKTKEFTFGSAGSSSDPITFDYPSSQIIFKTKHGNFFSKTQYFEIHTTTNKNTYNKVGNILGNYSSFKEVIYNINTSVNGIKFKGNGTIHTIKDVFIKMAPHIKLNKTSLDFGTIYVGETKDMEIDFYSFLTKNAMSASYTNNNSAFTFSNLAPANQCEKIGENNYNVKVTFAPQKEGDYSGTVTITDGANTVTVAVTAKAIRKDQIVTWPEENLRKIKMGNTLKNPATSDAGLPLMYASSSTDIIEIQNGTTLVAKSPGTVSITATNDGNNIYNPASSTVTYEVTYKDAQTITWNQNFLDLMLGDADFALTATSATNNITYSSANEAVVKIVNGNTLKIIGVGETTITATDPGDANYTGASTTKNVEVAPMNNDCRENYIINATNGKNQTFNFTAPCERLTFTVSWGTFSTGNIKVTDATNNNELTSFSATGNSWTAGSKEFTDIIIPRNCRSIKFEGNLDVSNILLTQASYFEADNTPIDFGEQYTNTESIKTITFRYSHKSNNIKADIFSTLHTKSATSPFSVSQAIYQINCGQFGEQTVTVKFNPQETDVFTDKLVLSTGSDSIFIDLSATAKRRPQTITWTETNTLNVDNELENPAEASSKETIIYTSSDSTVIDIINGNTLKALKEGKATITAKHAGNSLYEPVESPKEFTVTAKTIQTITWDDNISYILLSNSEGIQLNATASSGLAVAFHSSDENIVRIGESNKLIPVAIGDAYVFAYQEGNDTYAPAYLYKRVLVRNIDETGCTESLIVNDATGFKGSGAFNWSPITKTYPLEHPGDKLSFIARIDGGATGISLKVTDNNNNTLYENGSLQTGKDVLVSDINIPLNATSVTISLAGNLNRSISNVQITRRSFLEVDADSYTFADGSELEIEIAHTFKVSYGHLQNGVIATLENENSEYALSWNSDQSAGCETYKTVDLTVRLNPKNEGKYEDIIILQGDNGLEKRIPISATIKKNPQILTWNQDLSNLNTANRGVALTCTSNIPGFTEGITYKSSDENIATISGNKISVVGIGSVTITATHAGNNKYESAQIEKNITTTRGEVRLENLNGDWNALDNWVASNGYVSTEEIPSLEEMNILIDGNYILNDNSSFKDLTIASNGNLTLVESATLNIENLVINSGGTLTLGAQTSMKAKSITNNSGADNLILKADENSSATLRFLSTPPEATVEIYSKAHSDRKNNNYNNPHWQYLGIAVNSQAKTTFGNALLYEWDETQNATSCWKKVGDNLESWKGYCFSHFEATTYTTSGTLNNINHTYNLTYTEPGSYDLGNNLITNSYSAPIDISKLTTDDFVNAEAAIYIYNTGSYAQWKESNDINSFEGTDAGQFLSLPIKTARTLGYNVIPQMQAFFVKATATGASFSINYETDIYGSDEKNTAMRAPKSDNGIINMLEINVSDNKFADKVYLLEDETCGKGYDNGYDGAKWAGGNNMPLIYATTPTTYNAVNTEDSIVGQIIGFRGAIGVNTQYRMTFNTSKLSGYETLYLYDSIADTYHDILSGSPYDFYADGNHDERRFHIVESSANSDDNNPGDDTTTDIQITGDKIRFSNTNGTLRIIDLAGKVLYSTEVNDNLNEITIPELINGIYIISLNGQTTKLIINK